MKSDAMKFPRLTFSGGVKVGKGGETQPPHPTHPPLGGGGGGEVSGRLSGVGKWWGKDGIIDGHAKYTRRALAHMVTDTKATVARSLEGADMTKDEARELVKEFGEGFITKLAEYGVDLEEYGPLVNGFVAYKQLGLQGVNELMDIAIKIVEPDAVMEMMKFIQVSK